MGIDLGGSRGSAQSPAVLVKADAACVSSFDTLHSSTVGSAANSQQPNSRSIQMKMTKAQKKVGKVMGEFKEGTLHSGKGGKVVTNPKQGIAIALSEAGIKRKK